MVRAIRQTSADRSTPPDRAPRQSNDNTIAGRIGGPLWLGSMTVSDYCGIHFRRIDAQGRHVIVDGPNATGKTSLLNALYETAERLSKDHRGATGPIRDGADKAVVEVTLINAAGEVEYIVKRTWTKSGTTLDVRNGAGIKIKGDASDLYRSFISRTTIDISVFGTLRAVDQVDLVLRKAGVAYPAAAILKICGEAHELRPGETTAEAFERLSADGDSLYYRLRLDAHRHCEQKLGALEEQRQVVTGLGGPIGPGEAPKQASQLITRMQTLQKLVDAKRAAKREAALHRDEIKAERDTTLRNEERLRQDRDLAVSQRSAIAKQIEELRAALARKEQELLAKDAEIATYETRVDKTHELATEWDADFSAAQAALDALPEPTIELTQITDIGRQIETVEADNKAFARRGAACEQLDRLASEFEEAKLRHKRLDDILAALRDLRAHLLDNFNLGIDIEDEDGSPMKLALTVADKELKVNGVSYCQASKAQQILVAAGLAMLEDPRLKVLRLDDGEHMDLQSRQLLFAVADRRGYEVLMGVVNERRKKREMRVQMFETYSGQEMDPDDQVAA